MCKRPKPRWWKKRERGLGEKECQSIVYQYVYDELTFGRKDTCSSIEHHRAIPELLDKAVPGPLCEISERECQSVVSTAHSSHTYLWAEGYVLGPHVGPGPWCEISKRLLVDCKYITRDVSVPLGGRIRALA